MQDSYPHQSELKPMWRDIETTPPPLGVKLLFKQDVGPAVIGIYYLESGWKWWCPLPSHNKAQRKQIAVREQMIYAHIG